MVSRIKKAERVIDSFDNSLDAGNIFIHFPTYPRFLVLDVLHNEVLRNVLFAILAVFLCTEMVLCNLVGSLIVTTNVLIGLINVCGWLYFIGMKLNIVQTMFITIAQGITVDYSAHIVHSFLKTQGGDCRQERIKQAMVNIGPAVFNGAMSTFLAFCLCAFGRMPLTNIIFKVFSLVVFSGLFGAFFVLPVVLSWFGPQTHDVVVMIQQNKDGIDNEGFGDDKDKKQQGQDNEQNNQTSSPRTDSRRQGFKNETNRSTKNSHEERMPSFVCSS